MRILIACTQHPYNGGAATNAYALIKALRGRGHKVCGVFFEKSSANCDPDNIGKIIKSPLKVKSYNLLRKQIIKSLGKPDIILAKNYVAPTYCRSMFPNAKIIYLVSGAPLMMPLSERKISAMKYLKSNTKDIRNKYTGELFVPTEAAAINRSDAVLVNSKISYDLFRKTYARRTDTKIFQPLNTSIISNHNLADRGLPPLEKRPIDVAFVCSNFSRKVKNADCAKKLFSNKPFLNKKKLVIGDGSGMFRGVPGTTVKKLISYPNIIKHLRKTKLLICTSYFDASPNIVREAIMSGCNILVSKNCGWSERYGSESVCDDVYDLREWKKKADYLCNNKVVYKDFETKDQILNKLEKVMKEVIKS